ncbi:MAG: sigma-54-dependent Fis family transcriptional regulator [Deltaproteobacteria bacterium]|nr:sigma-54-dependent Fis family transcriptional regulator [Deltaproteobacteria bacterium]
MARILIVDDEAINLSTLVEIFAREGFDVTTAENGKAALDIVRAGVGRGESVERDAPRPGAAGAAESAVRVDVVLTDLMMPVVSGLDLLRAVKTLDAECEVVLMTAFGTVSAAVDAMREGAYDFITKPFRKIAVTKAIRKALERQLLIRENRVLKAQLAEAPLRGALLGTSPAMKRIADVIAQTAKSTATVLVQGESGTGKELVARAIHQASARAGRPFVIFNCAAVPETLIESELFGYERGAFTGATARKEGRFDTANQGTLFFDEVAEMSGPVQAKLLRVLQFGEFERLGAVAPTKVDVRIVAATNRRLATLVTEGKFREDLYYRLAVITVEIPPLRERRDDIPLLAAHFIRRSAERNNKAGLDLTPSAVDRLLTYDWPGNVRELENAIERAVVLVRGDAIGPDDIEIPVGRGAARGDAGGALGTSSLDGRSIAVPLGTTMETVERRVIEETLRHTNGDKRLAAQILGIAPRTIYRKLPTRDRADAGPDETDDAADHEDDE